MSEKKYCPHCGSEDIREWGAEKWAYCHTCGADLRLRDKALTTKPISVVRDSVQLATSEWAQDLEARIKQHHADVAVLEHAMALLKAYSELETKTSRLRQENRELQAQVEALSKPGTHGAIVKWVHEFAEHPCGRSPVMSDSPIDHIVEHVESLNEMIATTQYSEDALWECLGLVDWTALDLPAGQVTKITDAIGIQDAKLVLAALKPKPGRGRS